MSSDSTPLSPNTAHLHNRILAAFSPHTLSRIAQAVRAGTPFSPADSNPLATNAIISTSSTISSTNAATTMEAGVMSLPRRRSSRLPPPDNAWGDLSSSVPPTPALPSQQNQLLPPKSSASGSGSATPQQQASQIGPTRSSTRKTRAQAGWPNKDATPQAGGSGAATPAAQTVAPQATAASSRYAPYPARSRPIPALQVSPIPAPPQASTTTYPSRLRTGTTLLMQPLHIAPPLPPSGPSTAIANPHASESRAKRRAAINYAELEESFDEEESDEEGDEAGSDYAGEGTGKATKKQPEIQKPEQLERSYLGEPPPAKHVVKRLIGKVPPPVHIPQADIDAAAEQRECLVPIRIEFDTDTHRVRDVVLWNVFERHLTPETFAEQFLREVDVAATYADQVAAMIRGQVEEFEGVALWGETGGDEEMNEGTGQNEQELDVRVFLNLDVQLSTYHLLDTLEYSLSPSTSSTSAPLPPSLLSRTLTADLALPPSSAPLIAHALTEEIMRRKKDAIEAGLLGVGVGAGIERVRDRARPKEGVGIWREVGPAGWVSGGAPRLEVLSGEERERREGERERAIRRLRREVAKQQTGRRRR